MGSGWAGIETDRPDTGSAMTLGHPSPASGPRVKYSKPDVTPRTSVYFLSGLGIRYLFLEEPTTETAEETWVTLVRRFTIACAKALPSLTNTGSLFPVYGRRYCHILLELRLLLL